MHIQTFVLGRVNIYHVDLKCGLKKQALSYYNSGCRPLNISYARLIHWFSILNVDCVISILLIIQAADVGGWLETSVFNIVFNSVITH